MPNDRRRSNDLDRRRWNDQALDGLAERVNDVVRDIRQAEEREERRIDRLHQRLDGIMTRLEAIERATRALTTRNGSGEVVPARSRLDWKTVVAVAATIVVPIVVAIISTRGG